MYSLVYHFCFFPGRRQLAARGGPREGVSYVTNRHPKKIPRTNVRILCCSKTLWNKVVEETGTVGSLSTFLLAGARVRMSQLGTLRGVLGKTAGEQEVVGCRRPAFINIINSSNM